MNALSTLRSKFAAAISQVAPEADCQTLSAMVKPSADAKFGDYQANMAMAMAKPLGKPPRDVAAMLIAAIDVNDLCETPEIAGPGFINLTIRDTVLVDTVSSIDGQAERLIPQASAPLNVTIDFSSPNVAKPMHVGHLRSTVIGDSLQRIYRALGHTVISDNHVGDWGTQFGMILFGYKNFRDEAGYAEDSVAELARLYREVNSLIGMQAAVVSIDELRANAAEKDAAVETAASAVDGEADKKARKKLEKALKNARNDAAKAASAVSSAEEKIASLEADSSSQEILAAHANIAEATRLETAALHSGDAENVRLWNEFIPACMAALQSVYNRLDISFDLTLGESHYNPLLADVVADLEAKGLATESDGATCVFVEGYNAPLIVRKADGAFTYGTTDFATIQDRVAKRAMGRILYVVDARQAEHFKLLFDTAQQWGYAGDYRHVSFGTVLGRDNTPFKTRSGDAVGLESLLDEAVARATEIVSSNDDGKPNGPELDAAERARVGTIVGLGGIKYADLMHNRESDYMFSYEKMLATRGNTATYMQYAYARTCGIFRKAGVAPESLGAEPISLDAPAERLLALKIARFGETVASVIDDNRPNVLTDYLFDLANAFSQFFEQCPVVKAETDELRESRLKLVRLTGDVIRVGLDLLGIGVCEKM